MAEIETPDYNNKHTHVEKSHNKNTTSQREEIET